MIGFLRKIRKSLLESGKASKYLLYALGEILLVVIGILIALQINNWNQNRIDRINENRVLKSIADEINGFRWKIERGIDTYQEVVLASGHLLKEVNGENNTSDLDSMDYALARIGDRWLFGKGNITTIYDALTGSGELGLIGSDQMRYLLDVIKREILLLGYYEEIQVQYVDNQLQPILNRYYNGVKINNLGQSLFSERFGFDPDKIDLTIASDKFQTDYDAFLNSKEFSNILLQHMKRSSTLIPIYHRLKNHVAQIDSILSLTNPDWIIN